MTDEPSGTSSRHRGGTDGDAPAWHALNATDVADHLAVDVGSGLSADEAAVRHEQHGPNELAADEPRGDPELLASQCTSRRGDAADG